MTILNPAQAKPTNSVTNFIANQSAKLERFLIRKLPQSLQVNLYTDKSSFFGTAKKIKEYWRSFHILPKACPQSAKIASLAYLGSTLFQSPISALATSAVFLGAAALLSKPNKNENQDLPSIVNKVSGLGAAIYMTYSPSFLAAAGSILCINKTGHALTKNIEPNRKVPEDLLEAIDTLARNNIKVTKDESAKASFFNWGQTEEDTAYQTLKEAVRNILKKPANPFAPPTIARGIGSVFHSALFTAPTLLSFGISHWNGILGTALGFSNLFIYSYALSAGYQQTPSSQADFLTPAKRTLIKNKAEEVFKNFTLGLDDLNNFNKAIDALQDTEGSAPASSSKNATAHTQPQQPKTKADWKTEYQKIDKQLNRVSKDSEIWHTLNIQKATAAIEYYKLEAPNKLPRKRKELALAEQESALSKEKDPENRKAIKTEIDILKDEIQQLLTIERNPGKKSNGVPPSSSSSSTAGQPPAPAADKPNLFDNDLTGQSDGEKPTGPIEESKEDN